MITTIQHYSIHETAYILVLALILASGCKTKTPVDMALDFAGDNRKALEKVLEHYRQDGEDSLKYKAACFLIANMPNYWSCQSDRLTHFRKELYQTAIQDSCTGEKAVSILQSRYGRIDTSDLEKIYDAKIITADYLIRNIDLAFKVWKEQPWCKHISFGVFCEEILPYRGNTEPLEDWRQAYLDTFRMVTDSMKKMNSADPVIACRLLYNIINTRKWILFQYSPLPGMGSISLLTNHIGSCVDRSDYVNYAMRALGIPGGTDYILQYPNRLHGHSWNYVRDTTGRCIEFELYEHPPGSTSFMTWRKGRVYRRRFGLQDSTLASLYDEASLPPLLNDRYRIDVSTEYFKGRKLNIDDGADSAGTDQLVYLSTFNNKYWLPIMGAPAKNAKATFLNVEDSIVYLPTVYRQGRTLTACYPLIPVSHDSIKWLKPNTSQRQTLTLNRKYPIQPWWDWFKTRPLGGKFQGADNESFRNPETFYTIRQESDLRWHRLNIHPHKPYRYIRYLSGENRYCDIAEAEFYCGDSLLKGRVIGTEGSYFNDTINTKMAVFDGDPLTAYEAKEASGAWSGLDLGHPRKPGAINYIFRNDDNGIRRKDEYELFYWDNGWVSIGRIVATEDKLRFTNCPVGALFLLHDHTRGVEERIFTYENDRQVWW